MKLTDKLEKLLKTRTTRELAKEIGVSDNTLILWKKGVYMPNRENERKIDELFGGV